MSAYTRLDLSAYTKLHQLLSGSHFRHSRKLENQTGEAAFVPGLYIPDCTIHCIPLIRQCSHTLGVAAYQCPLLFNLVIYAIAHLQVRSLMTCTSTAAEFLLMANKDGLFQAVKPFCTSAWLQSKQADQMPECRRIKLCCMT